MVLHPVVDADPAGALHLNDLTLTVLKTEAMAAKALGPGDGQHRGGIQTTTQ
jgi:hypothetical protein